VEGYNKVVQRSHRYEVEMFTLFCWDATTFQNSLFNCNNLVVKIRFLLDEHFLI
jgi:hypothetical protein